MRTELSYGGAANEIRLTPAQEGADLIVMAAYGCSRDSPTVLDSVAARVTADALFLSC